MAYTIQIQHALTNETTSLKGYKLEGINVFVERLWKSVKPYEEVIVSSRLRADTNRSSRYSEDPGLSGLAPKQLADLATLRVLQCRTKLPPTISSLVKPSRHYQ